MSPSPPTPRPEPLPPADAALSVSEYRRFRELAGLVLRAPRRRRGLSAAVFLLGVLATVAAVLFVPRVYSVHTKILAQRNLVMPSLGNPRRSVPSDSDAPTRAAADMILGRDNLVAIAREADLVARWDRERAPAMRLVDRARLALGPPLTDADRERAIVGVLEKKLWVQVNEGTIRISVEWGHPQTAYDIVATAERNFFAQRSSVEISVIEDTIGILTAEANHQREAVDTAFARVLALSAEAADAAAPAPAASARPTAAPRPVYIVRPPSGAGASTSGPAALLEEKRRAIRAIEEPRQRKLADLRARREQLLSTYTEAHPSVLELDSEIRAQSVEPPELAELRQEEAALVAQVASASAAAPSAPRVVRRVAPRAPAPAPAGAAAPPEAERDEDPELATAKAKLAVATRRYEDMLDRIDSARIELETAQAAFKYRYVVVEPPEVPRKATRPSSPVIAAAGLVLSVFLAVFAAAAKDLSGGRFVEAWQVRRLPFPLLAEVEER